MSEITQTIKDKIDIVDYIGRYVKLKKTGQNFGGLCPFHREKSPSFFVSPQRQTWHCFGCGRGGDIFTFVMEREALDFSGALTLLAKETNTPLPKSRDYKKEGPRQRLYEALDEAYKFFSQNLAKNEAALNYLTNKRHVTKESIEKFKIGFAPDSWDMLGKHLLDKGFTIKELERAGLIIPKTKSSGDRGWYDRFRNRIMFSITDRIGRVVGFSGRILSGDEQTAKYVNSPETEVFKKSSLLYGFDIAKQSIAKQDYVIIVEGQLDVIALHQIGIKNVVAPQGSAFTPAQVKLINRLTKRAILMFDNDSAGLKATLRSLKILLEDNFEVKIAQLSSGKDPDESAQQSPEQTQKDIAQAKHYFNYLLDYATSSSKEDDPNRNSKISAFILPFIASTPNEVQKETLTQKLAEHLHISTKSLLDELAKITPKRKDIQPPKVPSQKPKRKMSRKEALFAELTAMLLQLPPTLEEDAIVVDILKPLSTIEPDNNVIIQLASKIIQMVTSSGKVKHDELDSLLDEKETKLADILSVKDLKTVSSDDDLFIATLEHIARDIEVIRIKSKIKELVKDKSPKSIEKINELTKKLKELQKPNG